MYIAPNSTIVLYKNLRLDSSYANTMWFPNVEAQRAFFASSPYATFLGNSYQRKDIGVIRLQARIGMVYDVTYMSFINTDFENKQFYAFVDRVEYVNNESVNIYYTLDVVQTYMFNWELHQCLIERQHSVTDVAGDNLEIESLEIGDAIADGNYETYSWRNYDFCVLMLVACKDGDDLYTAITEFSDADYTGGSILGGLPTGMSAFKFRVSSTGLEFEGLSEALSAIQEIRQNLNDIVSITYVPDNMMLLGSVPTSDTYSVNIASSLNGYTPVNKKLLTYPYCYLKVSNDQNESIDMRYEMRYPSSNNAINFKLYGVPSSTPELLLTPNYDNNEENVVYSLSISGFPQVPYADDGYKAWLAMNYDNVELSREVANKQYELNAQDIALSRQSNNIAFGGSMFNQGIGIAGNIALGLTGNPAGLVGAVQGLGGALTTSMQHDVDKARFDLQNESNEFAQYSANQRANIAESVAKKLPNTPHGGSTSIMTAIDKKTFYFQRMTIRRRFAEKVDKYFTMFGYAQNIVGVPNLHARQNFTYVKTSGSSVAGNIPQDDKDLLNTVFDRGIRFWVDYNNFEDYTVPNGII